MTVFTDEDVFLFAKSACYKEAFQQEQKVENVTIISQMFYISKLRASQITSQRLASFPNTQN